MSKKLIPHAVVVVELSASVRAVATCTTIVLPVQPIKYSGFIVFITGSMLSILVGLVCIICYHAVQR